MNDYTVSVSLFQCFSKSQLESASILQSKFSKSCKSEPIFHAGMVSLETFCWTQGGLTGTLWTVVSGFLALLSLLVADTAAASWFALLVRCWDPCWEVSPSQTLDILLCGQGSVLSGVLWLLSCLEQHLSDHLCTVIHIQKMQSIQS